MDTLNNYSGGVGTELKRLLHKVRIDSTPECPCDQRALLMDEQGIPWCRDNIDLIVGWMQEEAENRRLWFSEILAKLVVLRAIHNARIKERILSCV
jgi:hypothetical protein